MEKQPSKTQSVRFNPVFLDRLQPLIEKKGFSNLSEFLNFLAMDYVEKEEEREKILAQIGLLKVG